MKTKRDPKFKPEALLDRELDSLRSLRRRLCGYANSDSRCDCKYLAPRHGTGQPYAPRQGEQTGCCEVREAIYKLEIVKQGFVLAREARGPQPAKP